MEKYGQYRDKGSGIAPFFPIPAPPSSALLWPFRLTLFCIRLPLLVFACALYLLVTQHTPPGAVLRKANLWCILGIPGIWWIDLRVSGVRKGSLAQTPRSRLPGPGTLIVASHTSPIDALYLAAIFDPLFTRSYASTALVQPITLPQAIYTALSPPALTPPPGAANLLTLAALSAAHPSRSIVVFPEGSPSNGRAILTLTPSILSARPGTRAFPIALRYSPPDIVAPLPGMAAALRCLWRLASAPTHCIRVRVGPGLGLTGAGEGGSAEMGEALGGAEQAVLDDVAEALARLGRVRRVALGVREKARFVQVWRRRGWR